MTPNEIDLRIKLLEVEKRELLLSKRSLEIDQVTSTVNGKRAYHLLTYSFDVDEIVKSLLERGFTNMNLALPSESKETFKKVTLIIEE